MKPFLLMFAVGMNVCAAFSATAETPITQKHPILEQTSKAFNEVARITTPAVVSISAIKDISAQEASLDVPALEDIPGFGDQKESLGIGSGVIIRSDGIILTNFHVVDHAEKVTVGLDENTKLKAHVLGVDPKTDIAVLKLDEGPRPLPVINFANSDKVQVGDWAVAIGSPFGLSHSVTSGIISAKGRGQMGVFDIEDFIQTDAAINPGNSGGPLLNLDGQMIGLNAAIFSQTGGFIGIGFAISSNLTKQVAEQIMNHGRVIRGWIGVVAQDIDPNLAEYFKTPQKSGALISDITPNGPAQKSALEVGDVIVQYDKKPIQNTADLRRMVTNSRAGSKVSIEVIRNGKSKERTLTIVEQAQPKPSGAQQAGKVATEEDKKQPPTLGLTLQDVPEELSRFLGLDKQGTARGGAIITGIKPGSPAFDAGLEPGDIILKTNEKDIRSAKEFSAFAKKIRSKDLVVLYIQRGPDRHVFVPLKLQG